MDAIELYCYKIITDDNQTLYCVAACMQDAITHEEEIIGVKSCEYIGIGSIGDAAP
jgi:Fe-S-cluster-containing hydrogenase component 2